MRPQWLLGGVAIACGVALQLLFGGGAPGDADVPGDLATAPREALAPPIASTPQTAPARAPQAVVAPVGAPPGPPLEQRPLSVEQAQALMHEAAEHGDERQPGAGGLSPRVAATPAQRADPALYSAFESAAQRREVQAWTLGLQQIPHIRERIDQAAQSGERNEAELAEANQALEQLEQLQQHLQQSDPRLLPSPAAPTD